jgi:hypothetical protein
MNDQSADFDWVSAQSNCTVESVFRSLLAGVQKDVERRNGLEGHDYWRFAVVEDEDGFEVTRAEAKAFERGDVQAFVTFHRADPRINVRGDGVDVDLTILTGLNPSGACRLYVGEAEYAEWEVRKMALELLFFEEPIDD